MSVWKVADNRRMRLKAIVKLLMGWATGRRTSRMWVAGWRTSNEPNRSVAVLVGRRYDFEHKSDRTKKMNAKWPDELDNKSIENLFVSDLHSERHSAHTDAADNLQRMRAKRKFCVGLTTKKKRLKQKKSMQVDCEKDNKVMRLASQNCECEKMGQSKRRTVAGRSKRAKTNSPEVQPETRFKKQHTLKGSCNDKKCINELI